MLSFVFALSLEAAHERLKLNHTLMSKRSTLKRQPLTRREWLATSAAAGVAWCAWPLVAAPSHEEEEMILVPGGPFRMGTPAEQVEAWARRHGVHPSWLGGEAPQRTVELPAFRIDKYPVTHRRYAAFVQSTGCRPPPHWRGAEPPAGLLEHPVTFVSRLDAAAFATWAGRRLPSAAEWEKAARGTEGRVFPWRAEFESNRRGSKSAEITHASSSAGFEPPRFSCGIPLWLQIDCAGSVRLSETTVECSTVSSTG